jgi:hypothetical protein
MDHPVKRPQGQSPEARLISLLHSLSSTESSNRLMRRSDRELAIVALCLEQENYRFLFGLLGREKQKRVENERRYVARLGLRYPDYRKSIELLIAALSGRSNEQLHSYIRPRKNR